ncbi:MAG: hypothetical protein AAB354_00350 [candidate division KSB1 bacterium]
MIEQKESEALGSFLSLRGIVSDTGPLLSIFQSDQVTLLRFLYDRVYIPQSTLPEFEKHGAAAPITDLVSNGLIVICELNDHERERAQKLSEEIAIHPLTNDKLPLSHYPEAEAMVLLARSELQTREILLDEQAAREIAKTHGLTVIGFPGLLIRACMAEQITPEEVQDILLKCVSLGTHYSRTLIDGVYDRLKKENR